MLPGDGFPVSDADLVDAANALHDRRCVNIQRRLDNGEALDLLAAYLDDICTTGLRACAAIRGREDMDVRLRVKFEAIYNHMAAVQKNVNEMLATAPGKALTKDMIEYLADTQLGED